MSDEHPTILLADTMRPAAAPNPDFIRKRAERFPSAAALVEKLLPYMQDIAGLCEEPSVLQRLTQSTETENGHLPAQIIGEMSRHLLALDQIGHNYEAHGMDDKAAEAREVAKQLNDVFSLAQQTLSLSARRPGKSGNGKPNHLAAHP